MQAILHAVTRSNPALDSATSGLALLVGTGYVEVGLFFVLSGFILAYTYLDEGSDRRSSVADFALSRFARLYPVYVCAWAVSGLYVVVLNLLQKGHVHVSAARQLIDATTSLLCLQSWAEKYRLTSWNGPGWSICDEFFFYAAFAALFLTASRSRQLIRSGGWIWTLTAVTLLIKIAGAAAYCFYSPDHYSFADLIPWRSLGPAFPDNAVWQNVLTYCPIFRIGEFMLGIALARSFMARRDQSGQVPRLTITRIPAILVLVVYAAATAILSMYLPSLVLGIVILPLQALVIYRLAGSVSAWSGLLSAPMILLGEASYALYLFHDTTLSWVEAVLKFAMKKTAGEFPVYLSVRIPCVIAAVVISIIVYRLIEVPARKAIRSKIGKFIHAPKHRHIASPVETAILSPQA